MNAKEKLLYAEKLYLEALEEAKTDEFASISEEHKKVSMSVKCHEEDFRLRIKPPIYLFNLIED